MGLIHSIISFLKDPFSVESLRKEASGFHNRMYREAQSMSNKLDDINKQTDDLEALKDKLAEEKMKNNIYCLSIDSFGSTVDDMAWMKWVDGTYNWCNQKLIDGLLFTGNLSNTIGRNDCDIGSEAVKQFGSDKHDFGLYCASSDDVTIKNGKKTRFLEFGLSGGKPIVLDVIKSPVYDDKCDIIATTGIARDVTERVFTLIELSLTTQDVLTKEGIERLVNSNVYLGDKPKSTLFEFYNQVKDIL